MSQNQNGISSPFSGQNSSQMLSIELPLRGMVFSKAESPDVNVVTDVTDSLFANTNFPGSDLVARNIQRGRDHGLPGYNKYREGHFLGICSTG